MIQKQEIKNVTEKIICESFEDFKQRKELQETTLESAIKRNEFVGTIVGKIHSGLYNEGLLPKETYLVLTYAQFGHGNLLLPSATLCTKFEEKSRIWSSLLELIEVDISNEYELFSLNVNAITQNKIVGSIKNNGEVVKQCAFIKKGLSDYFKSRPDSVEISGLGSYGDIRTPINGGQYSDTYHDYTALKIKK